MKNSPIDDSNHYFTLAADYVMHTSCPVYLTGKAGTGKTTFLRYIKQHCSKNLVVVAPTGVAAINAGGVTMHSFFQLPFGVYVAEAAKTHGLHDTVVNRQMLLHNLRIGGNKKKLIKELELLIIDEVSMLRSDMLDAMDTVLRFVRQIQKPFGGVQVLLIGDLYQLPPVVKDHEADFFKSVYSSPFFFHARVFEQTRMVFIELKKIYRQNEQRFIDLLNKVRHNALEPGDYDLLNSRYMPGFTAADQQYITLTSHNAKADAINNERLQRLQTSVHEFSGAVKGDFSEKYLPTERVLKLKEGAQVMFIKNDSSGNGRYYNGRIATVRQIDHTGITVQFPDTQDELLVEKETWSNITYRHNEETQKAEEELLGSFTQYPLRLAWAITIHKSQGLTFTHATIDAGSSFAPGQVYVALSRCTSLEGIVLQSKLSATAIHSDTRIQDFGMGEQSLTQLQEILVKEKLNYKLEGLCTAFHWKPIEEKLHELYEKTLQTKLIPVSFEAIPFCNDLFDKYRSQEPIAVKFVLELRSLFNELSFYQNENSHAILHEKIRSRLLKAITYFVSRLHHEMVLPLQLFTAKFEGMARVKKYLSTLSDIQDFFWQSIMRLQTLDYQSQRILTGDLLTRHSAQEKRPRKGKKVKGDSAKESFAYFQAGKSVEEISKIRRLAKSTIEGHLAEFALRGELEVARFVSDEEIAQIKSVYNDEAYFSTSLIVHKLKKQVSHGQVKIAVNHLIFTEAVKPKPVKPFVNDTIQTL